LQKYKKKDHDHDENTIYIPKALLKEEKWIKKVGRRQLKEKKEMCEMIEAKVISLRKELEKENVYLNQSLNFGKKM